MCYNIAIDGPAGAGKSTIARHVARQLDFIYVDTGAMYRAIALFFLDNGIQSLEEVNVKVLCSQIDIRISYEYDEQQVILNGENVTSKLRDERVSKMASLVAANPDVREKLLDLQRYIASEENVVMDGRDIGTVVLPNAQLKIYLTASVKVRADRRFRELQRRNIECDLMEIEADIKARDEQDSKREIAPLRQAEDAILIDTSYMHILDVVRKILELYEETQKAQ